MHSQVACNSEPLTSGRNRRHSGGRIQEPTKDWLVSKRGAEPQVPGWLTLLISTVSCAVYVLLKFSSRAGARSSSRSDLGSRQLLRGRRGVSRSERLPWGSSALCPLLVSLRFLLPGMFPSADALRVKPFPTQPEALSPWLSQALLVPIQLLDACHLPVCFSIAVCSACFHVLPLQKPHPCVFTVVFPGVLT